MVPIITGPIHKTNLNSIGGLFETLVDWMILFSTIDTKAHLNTTNTVQTTNLYSFGLTGPSFGAGQKIRTIV